MDSFGAALSRLLRDRDISASELAKRFGMRSKTTLQRILQDKSNYASAQKFWNQLLESDQLTLSRPEQAYLEQQLEILRVGPEAYRTHLALQSLLRIQPSTGEAIALHGIPGIPTFDALAERYASARELELTIIGLCDVRIFEALQKMCSRMPAQCQPKIRHYIFRIAEAPDTIRNIRAVFPLLFHRNYIVHMIPQKHARDERHFPGEMLLCRMVDECGQTHYHQLAFAERSLMHGIAYPDSAAYDYWHALIRANGKDLPPLKAEFNDFDSSVDYLTYIENYRLLEYNCNLYTIKPDVPINFVSPGIIINTLTDTGAADSFLSLEQQEVMISRLCESHSIRYRHFFERRKVTHTIFSQSAMLNFAKTGKQTDHFFGMRPYTPSERREILSYLLQQSEANPYFNIYFSNDDQLSPNTEISHYEGKGTMLLNAHTSYQLDGDHAEVLITHDGFNQQFRSYYVNELLRNHVLPIADGHAYLRQLIDIAGQAE